MAAAAKSVHDDEISGRIFDWKVYRRMAPFARPYVGWFLVSIVLLLILAAASILTPLALKYAMDRVVVPEQGTAGEPATGPFFEQIDAVVSAFGTSPTAKLTMLAVVLAAAGLLTFVGRYAQIWVANITGQRVVYDLRDHVFQHVQRRSLRFFDTNPVGRLVTRVTNDIEALSELFTSGIDIICYDLVMIGVTLGFLFWLSPELALLTLALIPFVAVWSFFFKREAQQLFRDVRARVTRLNSFINESITGVRVIQIFRKEDRTAARFSDWNGDLRDAHRATVRNFSYFYPGVEVFSALGAAVILIAGHRLFLGGDITIGTMLAFWFLLHKFFEPLRQISEKYNVLQSAMASAERVFRLLDDERTIPEPAAPVPARLDAAEPAIAFRGVTFSYDGRTDVLEDLNLEVARGEKIAIVGHTGAGKTSIINVLARFYDVREGSVLVGGVDVREQDSGALRRSIGVVLQDVFLFADTVRENIRLGDETIDDARILEACRAVHADRLLAKLPDGLDHRVRERGSSFSLGEKQLLAFARTLVHDPPVLVLDEATANIDTQTEILIQDALERLMRERTVIVIAHRLSTIKKADRIVVMHHGRIREIGTHRELLAEDGLYRRLYELQYRDQEAGERPAGR